MLIKRLKKADKVMEETNKTLKDVRKKVNTLAVLGSIAICLNIAVSCLAFAKEFKNGQN